MGVIKSNKNSYMYFLLMYLLAMSFDTFSLHTSLCMCSIATTGTKERKFWIKASNLPHGGSITESLGG